MQPIRPSLPTTLSVILDSPARSMLPAHTCSGRPALLHLLLECLLGLRTWSTCKAVPVLLPFSVNELYPEAESHERENGPTRSSLLSKPG